jgi:hypothetical protein
MGQRASSASHVHRLIYIKPKNQYGRFFFIYHFQPCFTVCLFVSPHPWWIYKKIWFIIQWICLSESLFPKILTLVYRPVPEKPVSLIFWLFPGWWQFQWIQSKVFMKIESRLGGGGGRVLFRESRVRRNLIAALMCGWKRNAHRKSKASYKIAIISICFSSQESIWPVVSPWSARRKLPLVFTMTA